MKNKKGFTLIEIIICVGMLAVIAVGSIVGINLVNKNLTVKELNQITNKAIQAHKYILKLIKKLKINYILSKMQSKFLLKFWLMKVC